MRNLGIIILVLFLIQMFTIELYGQDEKPIRTSYNNSLTFNLFGLFKREAVFGYERNLNDRNIIRLEAGRKFATSADSYKAKSFALFTFKNTNKITQGYSLGLGYKYILSTNTRFYLSAQIFYNHYYYDKKYYQFCVGTNSDSYVQLESMSLRTKGLNFIFGKKLRVKSGKNIGLEFDFFVATGIGLENKEFTIHAKRQGTCSTNTELQVFDPPQLNKSEKWTPTIPIVGVLITMPFIQK